MSATIEARLTAIEARLTVLEGGKGTATARGGKVADDRVFHGQYGNPDVTIDPKAWDGPSMKGQRFSDVPVEWLDLAASMYDAFGDKATAENKVDKNGKPVAWRDYQKAALCRRWAQEKRAEEGMQKKHDDFSDDPSAELPF